MPADRPDEPDNAALQSAIDESRIVIDHQIDLVAKMDDIAMHTLRTSVLVISVLVSAAGLAGPTAIAALSAVSVGLFTLGFVCLFATVLFGLTILSTSSLPFGISEAHRHVLVRNGLGYREWNALILEEYGRWEREMERTGERNSRWLSYVIWSFFTGIACLALGAGVMSIRVVG